MVEWQGAGWPKNFALSTDPQQVDTHRSGTDKRLGGRSQIILLLRFRQTPLETLVVSLYLKRLSLVRA